MFQSTRPQGARRGTYSFYGRRIGFNPRARRGRDCGSSLMAVTFSTFQSTRPQGARLLSPAALRCCRCFNPRARRGRDGYLTDVNVIDGVVSIHAPAGGATKRSRGYDNLSHCFNPRARRGRDKLRSWGGGCSERFNPRARRGRDSGFDVCRVASGGFQSTRPQGARLSRSCTSRPTRCFNPRARRGRDSYHCVLI